MVDARVMKRVMNVVDACSMMNVVDACSSMMNVVDACSMMNVVDACSSLPRTIWKRMGWLRLQGSLKS